MGNVIMKLGSGTFGRVLTSTDVPYAFKAVRRTRNIPILQAEFGWTQAVHNALKGKDFIGAPSAVAFIDGGDPNTLANIPDLFTEDLLEGCDQEFTSVLISDRVYPVSRDLRQEIVESFCPEALKPLHTSKPFIARVYLGRQDIEQRKFASSIYQLTSMPARWDFSLARLHFIVGTDGRDLEIILGMGDNPTKDKIYVIDCNQFRAFSGGVDDVPNLVDAVITNDPYFPRQGVLLTHMLDAYTTEVQAIAAINGTGDILTIGEHFVTQLGFALKGLSKF
ncbi:hypothetical protein Pst134EA_026955 [Puccinia striiformis f. sp. tritici]|uniref:hypothetical protein n=1 Tax=Puccinia striiformis f. sp. tritici TaxID=168172 RepID=UPI00200749F2|nr:hypothetical protein Pst134EA_026955 [Puccinia striiformis f. sp. tritici]KAH9450248.1 hypothetical protein Pst134EA_026955 [Puccinia striiformis f. sp. tritici]